MINFEKTYKMVLTDEDGNVYKSDNVEIRDANVYSTMYKEDMFAEIKLVMRGLRIKEAETSPRMPTAEEARLAANVIQEEKRKKAIEEEWNWLIGLVCTAVRNGNEYVNTGRVCDENKLRLIELGYDVRKEDRHWRIGWDDQAIIF